MLALFAQRKCCPVMAALEGYSNFRFASLMILSSVSTSCFTTLDDLLGRLNPGRGAGLRKEIDDRRVFPAPR